MRAFPRNRIWPLTLSMLNGDQGVIEDIDMLIDGFDAQACSRSPREAPGRFDRSRSGGSPYPGRAGRVCKCGQSTSEWWSRSRPSRHGVEAPRHAQFTAMFLHLFKRWCELREMRPLLVRHQTWDCGNLFFQRQDTIPTRTFGSLPTMACGHTDCGVLRTGILAESRNAAARHHYWTEGVCREPATRNPHCYSTLLLVQAPEAGAEAVEVVQVWPLASLKSHSTRMCLCRSANEHLECLPFPEVRSHHGECPGSHPSAPILPEARSHHGCPPCHPRGLPQPAVSGS